MKSVSLGIHLKQVVIVFGLVLGKHFSTVGCLSFRYSITRAVFLWTVYSVLMYTVMFVNITSGFLSFLQNKLIAPTYTSSVWIPVNNSSEWILYSWTFDPIKVSPLCGTTTRTETMSYRRRETGDDSTGLPRRYYSLPRNYSTEDRRNRRDSSCTSRQQSTTSSSTPSSVSSTASLDRKYGSLRSRTTAGSTGTSVYESPMSRSTGIRTRGSSSESYTSAPTASSVRSTESSSLDNLSGLQDPIRSSTSSYTQSVPLGNATRSSLPCANLGSSVNSERSSRRHHPNPEVFRDTPFSLSRKHTSGNQDTSTGTERPSAHYSNRTEGRRRTSSESATGVSCRSSMDRLARGNSDVVSFNKKPTEESLKISSENDPLHDSSTMRDISLLSREITSTYEGSLMRKDSSRRQAEKRESLTSATKSDEKLAGTAEPQETIISLPDQRDFRTSENEPREISESIKTTDKQELLTLPLKQPDLNPQRTKAFSHRRSFSDGSQHFSKIEDPSFGKTSKKNIFSRRKSSLSGIEDAVESKHSWKGLFSRKRSSSGSREDSEGEEKGNVPKRKLSGSGRHFGYSMSSTASKGNTEESKRKFSVPSKYFPSKDSDVAGSACSSPEVVKKEPRKRRVSLPGKFGFSRNPSVHHTTESEYLQPTELPLDADLHRRRKRQFKKAATFDCDSDKSKASVLHRFKFWDRREKTVSSDSRSPESGTLSPEDRQQSPTETQALKISSEQVVSNGASSGERGSRLRRNKGRKQPKEEGDNQGIQKEENSSVKQEPRTGEDTQHIPPSKRSDSIEVKNITDHNHPEPNANYVGTVEPTDSPSLRSQRRKQYKVNGDCSTEREEEKGKDIKDVTETMSKEDVKKTEAEEPSSALSKLRERRRRRKMERERFFAATVEPGEIKNMTRLSVERKEPNSIGAMTEGKAVVCDEKPVTVLERKSSRTKKEETGEVEGRRSSRAKVEGVTVVDGKVSSGINDHRDSNVRNGSIASEIKDNLKNTRHGSSPKISDIGKKLSLDFPASVGSKELKVRHRTIASTVHSDIITSLLREKGRNSHQEVKFPSVSELRTKFVSKDDLKTARINRKTEDRPHSICGGALSPTELKKFEDITFSLAKKESGEVVLSNKRDSGIPICSDATSNKVEKTIETTASPPSKPKGGDEDAHVKNIVNDAAKDAVELNVDLSRPTSPEGDPKRSRGSKKKRKKSIFGSDKDHSKTSRDTTEEQGDGSQPAKVSALKAMFGRRTSISKSRPKALAAGLKSELLKKASEMTQRREDFNEMTKEEIQSKERILDVGHTESPALLGKEPIREVCGEEHSEGKDVKNKEEKHTVETQKMDKKEKKSLKKGEKESICILLLLLLLLLLYV